MSRLKKWMAVALAVVMALALAVPAMGATGDGTLTITNVRPGETYKIYRIMDLDWAGNNYAYTVNSSFQNFFSYEANYSPSDSFTDATDSNQVHAYIREQMPSGDENQASRKEFANKLVTYVNGKGYGNGTADSNGTVISSIESAQVKNDANQVVISELPYGWYLVIPTFANTGADTANPDEGSALFELNTLTSTVTIRNKSLYPTPIKTVTDSNESNQPTNVCAVGDTLTFSVSGQMPNMNGYSKYEFIINDSLSKMTYVTGTATMKIGNADPISLTEYSSGSPSTIILGTGDEAITLQYKLTIGEKDTTSGKQTITLEMLDLVPGFGKTNGYAADTNVVFSYQATVDQDAVVGESGNDNTVYYTYSSDPTDTTKKGSSVSTKTTTFVLGLQIKKEDTSDNKLNGAEFLLQKKASNESYVDIFATDGKNAAGDTITSNTGYNSKITMIENEVLNSSAEGYQPYSFMLSGLDAGEYRLIETKAPEGKVKLKDTIQFTVSATGQISSTDGTSSLSTLNFNVTSGNNNLGDTSCTKATGMVYIEVKNTTQTELPSTGGAGLYVIAGVAIVALLGFGGTALLKRKVNGED